MKNYRGARCIRQDPEEGKPSHWSTRDRRAGSQRGIDLLAEPGRHGHCARQRRRIANTRGQPKEVEPNRLEGGHRRAKALLFPLLRCTQVGNEARAFVDSGL